VVGVGRTHYLRILSAESRKWLEGAGPLDLYATAGECFYNSLKEESGLAFKKNNRGRLPERHEYLSMLAAFTTK